MVESLLLSAAVSAGGTALPWLTTAGSLSSIASAGGVAGAIAGSGSLLSSGFSAFGALGQIVGGNQQAAVSKAQAAQYALSARQEELKGREQADMIRRSLQASLASQNAIYAARGVSTRTGTPVTIGNVSRTEASRDIETAQFNAGMSAGAERLRATQAKIEGKSAKTAGYSAAATKLYGARDSFGSLI